MTRATYAAQLTAPGVAAIATIAIDGPDAWHIARQVCRPFSDTGELPTIPPTDRVLLCRMGETRLRSRFDTVVVNIPRMAPSPRVEIHCHGGVEVIRWIMEMLIRRGAEECPWQAVPPRNAGEAFATQALGELAEALTLRTAGILLDQYRGAFAKSMQRIDDALAAGRRADAKRELSELARYSRVGGHLTRPWRVAILGAPNVGKSSLINALAGFERCITSSIPGTTRDLVTTLVAIDGWPVELIDTAGMRDTANQLERQGVHLARETAQTADLCIWVLDASSPPVWPDAVLASMRSVINKADLPAAWDQTAAPEALPVSALTKSGVAELVHAIGHWLVPDPPPPGAAVPFTAELAKRVDDQLNAVRGH